MSNKMQAPEIAAEFGTTVSQIQRQVNFLKLKSEVSVDEVDTLNSTLKTNGLDQLPTRQYLGLPPHILTPGEIHLLSNGLTRVLPFVNRKKDDLNRILDGLPEEIETVDFAAVSSFVEGILEGELTGEESPDQIIEYVEYDVRRWSYDCELTEGPSYSPKERREVVVEAYNYSLRYKLK